MSEFNPDYGCDNEVCKEALAETLTALREMTEEKIAADERDEAIALLLTLANELHFYTTGIKWPEERQQRLDAIKETIARWRDSGDTPGMIKEYRGDAS